ncbi:MAG: HemK/PrmC family methyltransferase [Lautropia sp.]|nr:HemK/PrmC family methyltransferase [Lautropia sp.]
MPSIPRDTIPLAPCQLGELMRDSALPRHEARRLMSLVTGRPMTWLIAHDQDETDTDTQQRFQQLAARRRAGEPLAYLTGEQEFYGRPFLVSPAVLIPRADTETLIEVALAKLAPIFGQPIGGSPDRIAPSVPVTCTTTQPPAPLSSIKAAGSGSGSARIIDLGTGSGIIAITLALTLAERWNLPLAQPPQAAEARPSASASRQPIGAPQAVTAGLAATVHTATSAQADAGDASNEHALTIHAVDLSADALAIAQQNADRLGAHIQWYQGSWWDALPPDTPPVDLIVSNPPYIATGDHHLQEGDLRFEPPQALAAGPDGLDDLRQIITGARQHLKPGGWLLLEHGYDQEDPVQALLDAAGFVEVFTQRDLAGQPRVSGGRQPPRSDTSRL